MKLLLIDIKVLVDFERVLSIGAHMGSPNETQAVQTMSACGSETSVEQLASCGDGILVIIEGDHYAL